MVSVAGPEMAASAADAVVRARKIIHAAHEFEGVLLNTLLGPLEQAFSAMPGKTPDSESDNYHYLGMEALASTLAAGRGLGIADLIIRNLLTSSNSNSFPK